MAGDDAHRTSGGAQIDPVGVRKTIGMVFQRPNPFPTMSIKDNVVAGLKLQGERSKKKLDEVAERSLRGANLWTEVKDRSTWPRPGGCSFPVHLGRRRAEQGT